MKHTCVTARIGDDAKCGDGHIENMIKPRDKVSADSGCNPLKYCDFLKVRRAGAILAASSVAALANIHDIRRGLLLASSQNRVSASRVS